MTGRGILKGWFSTAKKPTQGQFSEWIDSYWHKSEDTIKITDVQNLSSTLAGKASSDVVDELVKLTKNKTGANVDSNGNIDLTIDSIPAGKDLLAVYINGAPNRSAHFYDPTTKLVDGFDPSITPTDTITLKFI